jgi:CMP-N-acetylneuraminic acid synthetase
MKSITVIIPARGGSKRLNKKNIYPVLGKPMIYWSIKAAAESKYITDVVVSTEDQEIENVARSYNAKIHKRDKELSKDHVFKMEAIRNAITYLEKTKKSDIYISLQANSPEITSDILDKAIEVFIENNRNELISTSHNCMQNAAFRILKKDYAMQKDLSTKCGFFKCDILDIHTIEDVKTVEKRMLNENYS